MSYITDQFTQEIRERLIENDFNHLMSSINWGLTGETPKPNVIHPWTAKQTQLNSENCFKRIRGIYYGCKRI